MHTGDMKLYRILRIADARCLWGRVPSDAEKNDHCLPCLRLLTGVGKTQRETMGTETMGTVPIVLWTRTIGTVPIVFLRPSFGGLYASYDDIRVLDVLSGENRTFTQKCAQEAISCIEF